MDQPHLYPNHNHCMGPYCYVLCWTIWPSACTETKYLMSLFLSRVLVKHLPSPSNEPQLAQTDMFLMTTYFAPRNVEVYVKQ